MTNQLSGEIDLSPSDQQLNFTSIYGPTFITFKDIDDFSHQESRISAVHSSRLTAGLLTMLILWVISKNRKTPIFILNQMSLFLLSLHSILYLHYVVSPGSSSTLVFTGFNVSLGDAIGTLVATNIVQVMLIMCIEASLAFQVFTMFKSYGTGKRRTAFLAMAVTLGTVVVAFYLLLCVSSIISAFQRSVTATWIVNVPLIMFSASVIIVSLLLSIKLFLAVKTRRFLGLKQFDTFHILLIMSTQSLIAPAVLVILSYSLKPYNFDQLSAVAVMLVTLSLPLSSMWAASANSNKTPSSSATTIFSATSRTSEDTYRADHTPKEKLWFSERYADTPTSKGSKWWRASQENESDDGSQCDIIARTTHELN